MNKLDYFFNEEEQKATYYTTWMKMGHYLGLDKIRLIVDILKKDVPNGELDIEYEENPIFYIRLTDPENKQPTKQIVINSKGKIL